MPPRTRASEPQIGRAVQRRINISKLQPDRAQPMTNAQLADQVGKLVAGELQQLYEAEDLNKVLPNLDRNALRLSWG